MRKLVGILRGGLLGMFIAGRLCTYNPSFGVEGLQYIVLYFLGSFVRPWAVEYGGVWLQW